MKTIKHILIILTLCLCSNLYAADAGETVIDAEFDTVKEPLIIENVKVINGVSFVCLTLGEQECDYAVAKALNSIDLIKMYNINRVFLYSAEGWGPLIFGYQVISLDYNSSIEEQIKYVVQGLSPEDQVYITDKLKEIEKVTGLKAVCSDYPASNCRNKVDNFLDLNVHELFQRSDIVNRQTIHL